MHSDGFEFGWDIFAHLSLIAWLWVDPDNHGKQEKDESGEENMHD
jgi:hypothetical protein